MTGITAQALAIQLVEAHDRGEKCPAPTQALLQQALGGRQAAPSAQGRVQGSPGACKATSGATGADTADTLAAGSREAP